MRPLCSPPGPLFAPAPPPPPTYTSGISLSLSRRSFRQPAFVYFVAHCVDLELVGLRGRLSLFEDDERLCDTLFLDGFRVCNRVDLRRLWCLAPAVSFVAFALPSARSSIARASPVDFRSRHWRGSSRSNATLGLHDLRLHVCLRLRVLQQLALFLRLLSRC